MPVAGVLRQQAQLCNTRNTLANKTNRRDLRHCPPPFGACEEVFARSVQTAFRSEHWPEHRTLNTCFPNTEQCSEPTLVGRYFERVHRVHSTCASSNQSLFDDIGERADVGLSASCRIYRWPGGRSRLPCFHHCLKETTGGQRIKKTLIFHQTLGFLSGFPSPGFVLFLHVVAAESAG